MIAPGQVEAVSHSKDILFTLVLKVGFAASLAALLLRFSTFRRILFTERRDSDQKVLLLLFLTPRWPSESCCAWSATPFSISPWKSFLMGLIGGIWWGCWADR